MKVVKSYKEFLEMETCVKCKVHLPGGDIYEVTCDKCFGKEEDHRKEARKSIIDEIDTNGTKKEIKAFIKKDEDK